ncbi:hypothetical protein [Actinosynnema sp. NPDC023587]|uniref:hypothetical protein n=1 Tax=Actinosynnema sp. NPDC023587 TaxID=3154695 RepID=UPI003402F8AD
MPDTTPPDPTHPDPTPRPDATPNATRSGPGRLLIAVYGIFAIAATARSAVQIATRFGEAPVAYLLSALAAVVYVLATVTLAVGSRGSRRVAFLACAVELTGVLVVGAVSLLVPSWFPEATVWSGFGIGYGFVPLVLPVLGLLWLRHTRSAG